MRLKYSIRRYFSFITIIFLCSCGGSSAESVNNNKCVMLPCHGLDLQCVAKSGNLACTALYALGDGCRQYARCEQQDGDCSLVVSPQFQRCKECVENCSGDPIAAFECEAKCLKR